MALLRGAPLSLGPLAPALARVWVEALRVEEVALEVTLLGRTGKARVFLAFERTPVTLCRAAIGACNAEDALLRLRALYRADALLLALPALGSLQMLGAPTALLKDLSGAVGLLQRRTAAGVRGGALTAIGGVSSGVLGMARAAAAALLTSIGGAAGSLSEYVAMVPGASGPPAHAEDAAAAIVRGAEVVEALASAAEAERAAAPRLAPAREARAPPAAAAEGGGDAAAADAAFAAALERLHRGEPCELQLLASLWAQARRRVVGEGSDGGDVLVHGAFAEGAVRRGRLGDPLLAAPRGAMGVLGAAGGGLWSGISELSGGVSLGLLNLVREPAQALGLVGGGGGGAARSGIAGGIARGMAGALAAPLAASLSVFGKASRSAAALALPEAERAAPRERLAWAEAPPVLPLCAPGPTHAGSGTTALPAALGPDCGTCWPRCAEAPFPLVASALRPAAMRSEDLLRALGAGEDAYRQADVAAAAVVSVGVSEPLPATLLLLGGRAALLLGPARTPLAMLLPTRIHQLLDIGADAPPSAPAPTPRRGAAAAAAEARSPPGGGGGGGGVSPLPSPADGGARALADSPPSSERARRRSAVEEREIAQRAALTAQVLMSMATEDGAPLESPRLAEGGGRRRGREAWQRDWRGPPPGRQDAGAPVVALSCEARVHCRQMDAAAVIDGPAPEGEAKGTHDGAAERLADAIAAGVRGAWDERFHFVDSKLYVRIHFADAQHRAALRGALAAMAEDVRRY